VGDPIGKDVAQACDINGKPVLAGSSIRLLKLGADVFAPLSDKEIGELRSMIGEVFVVYEIDLHGHAWIEK
jgi:hypothetical protein